MDQPPNHRISRALDVLEVAHLRAPNDNILVELEEGFATFLWERRLGHIVRMYSLYDTTEIPADVCAQIAERWKAPGPPHGVVPFPDERGELNLAFCFSTIADDSTDAQVVAEVQRLLRTATRYTRELAALAQVSTWTVDDESVLALIDSWSG